jgi:hypothetical protein
MMVWPCLFAFVMAGLIDEPKLLLLLITGATLVIYTIATHSEPQLPYYLVAALLWVGVLILPALPITRLKDVRLCCGQMVFSLAQVLLGSIVLLGRYV